MVGMRPLTGHEGCMRSIMYTECHFAIRRTPVINKPAATGNRHGEPSARDTKTRESFGGMGRGNRRQSPRNNCPRT